MVNFVDFVNFVIKVVPFIKNENGSLVVSLENGSL